MCKEAIFVAILRNLRYNHFRLLFWYAFFLDAKNCTKIIVGLLIGKEVRHGIFD